MTRILRNRFIVTNFAESERRKRAKRRSTHNRRPRFEPLEMPSTAIDPDKESSLSINERDDDDDDFGLPMPSTLKQ